MSPRLLLVALSLSSPATADPAAQALLTQVLDIDAWALSGTEVSARALIKDSRGKVVRELAFGARSRKSGRQISKSLIRFTAPADLAGMAFLQLQQPEGDDDRFLFLPDLKKSRRVAGKTRSQQFMGTDFSYADLDRRDLRTAGARSLADEKIGKHDCHHLEVRPTGNDAEYSRLELWVRKDNLVPLRWKMFDLGGAHVKTLSASEVQRISGKWFLTRSVMTNHKDSRSTELILEKVTPRDDIPDDEFTVRNLEKA